MVAHPESFLTILSRTKSETCKNITIDGDTHPMSSGPAVFMEG